MDIYSTIKKHKIVPVIVLEDSSKARGLGETLMNAGLPIAEVTLRTNAALESIRIMATEFPQMLVGAGTVLSVEDLHKAKEAGATFAVSPCLDADVVKEANKLDMPIFPGVTNPTHAMDAVKLGLKCVKFFPAEASGGVGMLKSMGAVYPDLKFVPTGGISGKNVNDYLTLPNVLAVGGSWIVSKKLINEEKWDEIVSLISEALK